MILTMDMTWKDRRDDMSFLCLCLWVAWHDMTWLMTFWIHVLWTGQRSNGTDVAFISARFKNFHFHTWIYVLQFFFFQFSVGPVVAPL